MSNPASLHESSTSTATLSSSHVYWAGDFSLKNWWHQQDLLLISLGSVSADTLLKEAFFRASSIAGKSFFPSITKVVLEGCSVFICTKRVAGCRFFHRHLARIFAASWHYALERLRSKLDVDSRIMSLIVVLFLPWSQATTTISKNVHTSVRFYFFP